MTAGNVPGKRTHHISIGTPGPGRTEMLFLKPLEPSCFIGLPPKSLACAWCTCSVRCATLVLDSDLKMCFVKRCKRRRHSFSGSRKFLPSTKPCQSLSPNNHLFFTSCFATDTVIETELPISQSYIWRHSSSPRPAIRLTGVCQGSPQTSRPSTMNRASRRLSNGCDCRGSGRCASADE